jgi:hypothetical protein
MPDSTYALVSDFSCHNGCNFRIFFTFSLYSPARILCGPDRNLTFGWVTKDSAPLLNPRNPSDRGFGRHGEPDHRTSMPRRRICEDASNEESERHRP